MIDAAPIAALLARRRETHEVVARQHPAWVGGKGDQIDLNWHETETAAVAVEQGPQIQEIRQNLSAAS